MYCVLKVGYKARAVIACCTGHDTNEAAFTMLQSKYVTVIVGSCPIQQARVKNSPRNLLQKGQQCYLFVLTVVPKYLFSGFEELPWPVSTHLWYFVLLIKWATNVFLRRICSHWTILKDHLWKCHGFVACSLIAADCNLWFARKALGLVCGAGCCYQCHYE